MLSRLARLSLTYSPAGAAGPSALVAKVPADHPANCRLATAGPAYYREVSFYREMAAGSPLRAPRCFAAEIDLSGGEFVLLLEDLSTARVADPIAGCAPADAETVVLALSNLHAAWWDQPDLAEFSWLLATGEAGAARSTALAIWRTPGRCRPERRRGGCT